MATNLLTNTAPTIEPPIHWGHFGAIFFTIVLLLGVSWFKQPQLFSMEKNYVAVADANVPHYYAYVAPPEDQMGPMVAGASTNQGPMIIQDDGTVVPVDMEQVLGASTENVVLTLDDVKVPNVIPDSQQAIKKYFIDALAIESGPVDNTQFETALSSGNQELINQQALKLAGIRDALQKLQVPAGLVKLQKLKIIQYSAAVGLLQNFTQADQNPELVGNYLSQFLKSQQDLDSETNSIAQKYNLDPYATGAINNSSGLGSSMQVNP